MLVPGRSHKKGSHAKSDFCLKEPARGNSKKYGWFSHKHRLKQLQKSTVVEPEVMMETIATKEAENHSKALPFQVEKFRRLLQ